MIKKMILLPALVLSVSFSTATFANISMKDDGQCPCKMQKMERMAENLDLTTEQKNKIKEIKDEAKKDMKSYHEQMKSLNDQVKELVKAERIDEEKLNEVVNQKKDIMAQKMKAKIKMKNQLYNVLNEQQKTKFMSMMDKWEKNKMDRMNKMHDSNNNEMTTSDMDND